MKRASGAHNTDSNARNSWNEISLPVWVAKRCIVKHKHVKEFRMKLSSGYSVVIKELLITFYIKRLPHAKIIVHCKKKNVTFKARLQMR